MKTITFLFSLLLLSSTAKPGWVPQNSGVTDNLYKICFINENTGWISGDHGKILHTTNGGTNWIQQYPYTTQLILSLDFPSASTGYAVCVTGAFLKTTNEGTTWTSGTITGVPYLEAIDFSDNLNGYACGESGNIAKTTNGGLTWQHMVISGFQPTDIKTFNASTAIVSGISGKIYKTTNGGTTWTLQQLSLNNYISSMDFTDINNGYCTTYGLSEDVFKTSNGGNTWIQVTSPGNTGGLSGISMVNTSVIFGAGGYGKIRKTTNSGLSWETQTIADTSAYLMDIFMVNENAGYICGYNGTILKLQNTIGIQQIGTSTPKDYALSQNYPNPFNPSTKIKFSIPERQNVTIVVFDISGREIETLVNEVLTAGTYEADFNASKLSSGVYFYRIVSAGYSETKKMTLVK